MKKLYYSEEERKDDNMGENRNVKVKPETHERLKELGSYEDTMDDIIRELLNRYEAENDTS